MAQPCRARKDSVPSKERKVKHTKPRDTLAATVPRLGGSAILGFLSFCWGSNNVCETMQAHCTRRAGLEKNKKRSHPVVEMMSKEMKTLTFRSAFPRSPKFTLGDLDAFQTETDDLTRWQKKALVFWSRWSEGSGEELVSW